MVPLHTTLVNALNAPARERTIIIIREWNRHIDEELFLGMLKRIMFLKQGYLIKVINYSWL